MKNTFRLLLSFTLSFWFAIGCTSTEYTYDFNAEVFGEGQPIIFIPGAMSGGETWLEAVAEFSPHYQCHVLTMPGYAGVDPLAEGPYLETWKSQIVRYMEEQKLENVILVGHSLGGVLSLWIASQQIPQVSKVVVVDALPFFAGVFNPDAQTGFQEEMAQAYYESFSNFSDEEIRQSRLMMAKNMTKNEAKTEMMVNWALNSDLKTEAWSVTEFMGLDLRGALKQIVVPVKVFAAYEENPQFPKAVLQQTYETQYQHLAHFNFKIVENARHFIMFDQPEILYGQIRTFINRPVAGL